MKALISGYPYLFFWVLALLAFVFNLPIVGFFLFALSIPFLVRMYFQAVKRDKLLSELVVLIDEKTELTEMQPLVTDKETAEKIIKRLEEIEEEIKVPIEGLVKIGFLKRESE